MSVSAPQNQSPTIDICVCTFRRPHIAGTLRSLDKLTREPTWTVRIIVVDNDDTPSASALVEDTARTMSLPVTYIHKPGRNISIARNACLSAATADLMAFIDDDEIADSGWLKALIEEQQKNKSDFVLGPVQAIYKPTHPRWMHDGDFHATRPVWVGDKIITGYTCNVLMHRTAKCMQNLTFREDFGRSGGEDTFFFEQAHRNGGLITYAPNALVIEEVAEKRANFPWLAARYFRAGQTHGSLILENRGSSWDARAKGILLACSKALFCAARALPALPNPTHSRYWILRGTMHLGVVMRLLGQRELEQYG